MDPHADYFLGKFKVEVLASNLRNALSTMHWRSYLLVVLD
jgi:hypothetical protein